MLVTINTDASYRHDLGLGSYAFWIKCNNMLDKKSGMLKGSCNSSTDAEFKCVINALHYTLKTKDGITKIIINTDSRNVMLNVHRAFHGGKMKNPTMKLHAFLFKKMIGEIPYEFRHVKAHVKIMCAMDYVNHWCDKAAKKEMKSFLEKRRENAIKTR